MSHNIIQDIQDILWNIYDIFFFKYYLHKRSLKYD